LNKLPNAKEITQNKKNKNPILKKLSKFKEITQNEGNYPN